VRSTGSTFEEQEEAYLNDLRHAMLGDCLPENTVLLEITPGEQKTRIDFACTHSFLNVRPMCVTKVIKRGRQLFYPSGGREVRIERIFNRVIFDELLRKKPPMRFSFSDDLDVQWAGHPNWYFRISKHTLPFLQSPYVPTAALSLISLWEGFTPRLLPGRLGELRAQAAYSFAGLGVDIAPTRERSPPSSILPSGCCSARWSMPRDGDARWPREGGDPAHLRRRRHEDAAAAQPACAPDEGRDARRGFQQGPHLGRRQRRVPRTGVRSPSAGGPASGGRGLLAQ